MVQGSRPCRRLWRFRWGKLPRVSAYAMDAGSIAWNSVSQVSASLVYVDAHLSMSRLDFPLLTVLMAQVFAAGVAMAGDTGRIKRAPPSAAEAERLASELAMNDSLLQKGDIVVTDRGFFVFR